MKVSYNWLNEYFEDGLPAPSELARLITLHSYEVEGVVEKDGDFILDIDVLPNRSADSLSHDGIAKEIGSILDLHVKTRESEFKGKEGLLSKDFINLSVENEYLVPRAAKRVALDVRIKESPEWLKKRLELFGQRSINNVVDATNLVLLETGQPVHAFDLDKIAGADKKDIFIRRAEKGEEIETLDGTSYKLPEGALVIADSEKALDVAGIKGGSSSGIDKDTKRVLLSVCNFNATQIRKTSRALNLLTDASKRFEQGLSDRLVSRGMERLSELVAKLTGAELSEDFIDNFPHPKGQYMTGVSTREVNSLLGTTLNEDEIASIFKRLYFSPEILDPRELVVRLSKELLGKPYKYGASVSYDAPHAFSCSSLTAYIFSRAGYSIPRVAIDQFVFSEKILEKDLRPGDLIFSRNGDDEKKSYTNALTGRQETISKVKTETIDFMPGTEVPEGVSHCGIYVGDGRVLHAAAQNGAGEVIEEALEESVFFKKVVGCGRVINDDKRVVAKIPFERTDVGRGVDLIEEIGRIYGYAKVEAQLSSEEDPQEFSKEFFWTNKIKDFLVDDGYSEVMTYVLREVGEVELQNPLAEDKSHLRDSLKSGLSNVLRESKKYKALLDDGGVNVFEIGKVFLKDHEELFLGIASGDESRTLKSVERLEDELDVKFEGNLEDGVWEASLEKILDDLPDSDSYEDLRNLSRRDPSYRPTSSYPYTLRDIAVWVPEDVSAEELRRIIKESAGELLVKINLFDEYRKENKVSYAHSLVFQSTEKTLSDEEVNEIMSVVERELKSRGFEVR